LARPSRRKIADLPSRLSSIAFLFCARAEAIRFRAGGFYSQSMPSFQGEWGFMLASTTDTDPFDFTTRLYGLPAGLVVADTAQIHSWANKPLIWQTATQAFTRYV
jgi:hypothetical protein